VLDSLWSEYRRFIETGISMTGYEFGTTSAEYLSQWEGEAVLGQFRKGLVDQHEAEFGSVDFHQLEYEQFRNSLPFWLLILIITNWFLEKTDFHGGFVFLLFLNDRDVER